MDATLEDGMLDQGTIRHATELSPGATSSEAPGDILYGARSIAVFLFGSDDSKARRRVFNLWSHYQYRKEKVGLFKLKGAVCLSKSQWKAFRG